MRRFMSGLDHPHQSWNIVARVQGPNLFGSLATTAGTERVIFGSPVAGIVRLILTLCGFPIAGSTAMAAGC